MYLQFYRLNEQPFGVTPDPRFLYMGPAHQEAFASLVYGVETGRGFMALIAAPGLGKTTLVLRLMERLRNSALTAFLFQTHTNSREFLKNLLLDLDISPAGEDLSDLQGQLREVLLQALHSGKRLVLVIDEAQNLDDAILETVRMLSNFETPQAKLLQVVLVGQPALADKLARPHLAQLRQRISIITHFPPLQGAEVEKYIRHRLRVAGYKGGNLFTTEAMALIVKYSRGIPRIINNLCFNALSLGYAKGQKKIDESTFREAIADLNLETLGERRTAGSPGAPPPVSAHRPVKGAWEEPQGRSQAGAADLEIGPQAWGTTASELLDRVNVASYTSASAGRMQRSHKPAQLAEVLVFLVIIAISVFMWKSPWLRPGLDSLGHSVWVKLVNPPHQVSLSTAERSEGAPTTQGKPTLRSETSSNPSDKIDADSDERKHQKIAADTPEKAPSAASSPFSRAAEPSGSSPLQERADQSPLHSPRVRARRVDHSRRNSRVEDMERRGLRGTLVVQSSVPGALITINGRNEPRWVTPHLFSLIPNTYIVSVSKGQYLTWTSRVHVDAWRKKWIVAEMTRDEGDGIFVVDTDPTGMQVFIDGKPYGSSRVETALRPGWHVCEVLPGRGLRPVMSKFHLNPGEALTKRIRVTSATAPGAPAAQHQPGGAATGRLLSTSQGGRLE